MLSRYVFPLLLIAFTPGLLLADGNFDDLVKQLDSDKFKERQSASKALSEAGLEAVPTLEKAAQSRTLEISVRALEVLQDHFKSDNAELKDAAKKALEAIAKGSNENAASRAKRALEPEKEKPAPGNNNIFGINGIGNIQIRGGGRIIQVQQGKGIKQIEVNENGNKVKIREDANGIEMEITQTKDGKQTTEKYKAKDEAELKKKHPAAHKLYEKHTANNNRIQIQGIRIQGGPQQLIPANRIQRNFRVPKVLPPGQAEKAVKQLQEADEEIGKAVKQLKERAEDSGDAKAKETLERLEAARKNLQEVKKRLES